jgi:methionine-rich copper-binding protein CopC
MHTLRLLRTIALLPSLLISCAVSGQESPFLGAEPGVDSVLSNAPRTLRLFFQQLPDVAQSEVTLVGPGGPVNLRGLHTMGANDLMMEIFDETANGVYTVNWRTVVADDPNQYSGSYTFTVQTALN